MYIDCGVFHDQDSTECVSACLLLCITYTKNTKMKSVLMEFLMWTFSLQFGGSLDGGYPENTSHTESVHET